MSDMCRRRPPETVAAELDVLSRFANAIQQGDLKTAGSFLLTSGHFMVASPRSDDRPVGKRAFLIWLSRHLNKFRKENGESYSISWSTDRCFDCVIGRPVLLFNGGTFPVKNKQPWQTQKTGFAMQIENGLIVSSLLCSSFMLCENPFNKPDPIDPEALLEEPGILN